MTAYAPVSAPPADPADRFVVLNGTRLRYRDEGRGPAVLLVHGWTLDLEMWNPQVSALSAGFRLIRLDRRGHGFSAGVSSPQRDREDLLALCAHLRLARVALLGMSQGVRAVLEFAGAAPGRVAGLILDGAPTFGRAPDPEVPLRHFAALARARGIEAFRAEWAHHPLMQLRSRDAKSQALLAAMIARYAGNDLLSPVAEAEPEPIALESLAVPALVLSGELDLPSRRQAARQLATRLPNAELAVIPAAGHLPNLDSPDSYNTLCRNFLSRHCCDDSC